MNEQTLFAHRDSGHLPAELKIINRADFYRIEFRNEGGGGSDQQWKSAAFGRSVIASMVAALTAHLESLPPSGTFKCPICSVDSIHAHSGEEVAEYRIAAGAPAETIDQVRANFENWYVTHIDGAVIGSADCAARWSSWLAGSTGQYKAPSDWKIAPMPWGAPAETPKPVPGHLLDALIEVCDAALPVTNVAYNIGQSHEQWATNIKPSIDRLDKARRAAHKAMHATPAATIGAGEGKDAARLEFLMEREAWIAWSKDGESCRVFHRDDEGDTGPIMGWIPEAWAHDPREAIDKARAATRSKTSPGEAG